jgi:hypothetical protein
MDPMECVRAKTVFGGCAPQTVLESIQRKTATVKKDEAWLAERKKVLADADKMLAQVCRKIQE